MPELDGRPAGAASAGKKATGQPGAATYDIHGDVRTAGAGASGIVVVVGRRVGAGQLACKESCGSFCTIPF